MHEKSVCAGGMYEMTRVFALIIPLIFLASFVFALIKKVKVYDSFANGAKGAIPLIVSIFPYIATVTMMTKLFEVSGLEGAISAWLSPLFSFTGIPNEIAPLILVKPLSGSGSIAVLADILSSYGVDSYIARCACVAYGSSETVFYIGAVYFANIKRKKLSLAVAIALFSYFASLIVCCSLCKIM